MRRPFTVAVIAVTFALCANAAAINSNQIQTSKFASMNGDMSLAEKSWVANNEGYIGLGNRGLNISIAGTDQAPFIMSDYSMKDGQVDATVEISKGKLNPPT